ncbi:dTDP-4-dehydrorhamnose reductase [bacterium]|nr:dTDP-4-dehydrorhamnose reductase [bacterium]
MRKVLVLGHKGMLGTDLCARLRPHYQLFEADIDELDITDHRATQRFIRDISPSEVVNCVGYTNVDGAENAAHIAYEVNAEGAKNAAQAADAVGARYIYIGTDFVFDGTKGASYQESDPTNPLCVYARSKLVGELYTREYSERHLIVRTAWLFGVHGKNFVEAILRQAKVGDLRVVDDQVGSPTFAVDLSEGLARLLASDETGTFHCTNSGCCSWFEFAKGILEAAGILDVKVSRLSSEELGRAAARPAYSPLDNEKLNREIGFKMPTWRDALARYMKAREVLREQE